jgi:hypothetical protein
MMPGHWCYHLLSTAVTAWQESGENPALFCYLIAWGTFAAFRSRKLVPILNSARHQPACSTPFLISSAPSIAPKD